ncbi:MAG: hypothetical protein HY539_01180 [Deltaproteobacteria bacterium]|nr:hypothetical protein [Deltaproteobacteria bacterium]
MLRKFSPLFLLLILPFLAEARPTSFDTLRFHPATDQGLYLQIYGAELLERRQWSAGFHLDYVREPLAVIDLNDNRQPVVRDLIGAHLSAAVGILDWLEVGINPNIALYEKFFDPVTGAQSSRIRLGDTRVGARIRLLSKEDYPIGIALIPFIDLPTGSGASYVGNNSFAGGGLFALETRRIEERLTFAMNLGYWARDRVVVVGTPFDDLLTFGLAGNFLVVRWLELIAEFQGGTTVSGLFEPSGTPFEGGGGARYSIGKERRIQITTAVSAGVGSGLGNPSIRGVVGLSYTPPRRVKGVEIQESATEAFQVYELQVPDEMERLRQICPERQNFNKDRDDPRCIKLYLSQ